MINIWKCKKKQQQKYVRLYNRVIPGIEMQKNQLIKCHLLGYELSSPIIVGSGPLTDSYGRIDKFFTHGAGTVVSKTIYNYTGIGVKEEEKIHVEKFGLFNSTTYSTKSIGTWINILSEFKNRDIKLIPSIHADSPNNLGVLAANIAEVSPYAVELGIACPNDGSQQKFTTRLIYEFTRNVRDNYQKSIVVKLAATDNYIDYTKAALDAGADAISISDTIPSIVYDVDQRKLVFKEPAGYSGIAIKPIVLHAIYQLRKFGIKSPIIGIGGIQTVNDILEYLHVGANAVQIYTALMFSKPNLISQLNKELIIWCDSNKLSIDELCNNCEPASSMI